jgi:ABC-type Fe3+-hydroxamate transport system substrate-binding protein
MNFYTDQIGHIFELHEVPKRVISLVPSQTEFLYDLGLDDQVIGITKFCIHPNQWFKNKLRIGGTKTLDLELIRSLKPDLIIANKEENNRPDIEALQKEFCVWTSDIKTPEGSVDMMTALGKIFNKEEKASAIVEQIKADFDNLNSQNFTKRSALYLIWNEPIMSVGHDTYIHQMLKIAGFNNLLNNYTRYPSLTLNAMQEFSPEVLLLSSEPFPFKEKHLKFYQEALPKTQIKLVDGEIFSWYGSRQLKAKEYIKKLRKELN